MFQEFPKALYLSGWDDLSASITVNSAEEEEQARADGYRSLDEPVAKRRGRPPKTDTSEVTEAV